MNNWKEMTSLGTAYTNGSIVWGAIKDKLFYSESTPNGTSMFAAFVRMDWCSPKEALFIRNSH